MKTIKCLNITPTLFAVLTVSLLVDLSQALADQPPTLKEKQIIHQAVLSKEEVEIETKATRRTDDVLTEVFSARFYDVTIIEHAKNQTLAPATRDTAILARLDDQMIDLKSPTTNEPLPNLQRILNNDFQIKSLQNALILEKALDILYPISTSFGHDDLDKKAILQKGNQWFFIRGAFFDDLAGFVFSTDTSGNITSVSYSLGIPANLPAPPPQPHSLSLTQAEEQAIHAAILARKKVEIETDITRLDNKALSRVFSAQFYDTTIIKRTSDYSSESETILAIQKDKVITLEGPSTNQPMPELQQLLNKEFQLKTRQDASTLEETLDILYPVRSGYGSDDIEHKAIRQNGNQWLFIRGVFFRDLKGYIFETDDKGNILSVNFSLEIPDNNK